MARNYCRVCGRRIAPGLTVCGPECAGIDALPDEAFDEAAGLASNWRAKRPANHEPKRKYRRHEKSPVRKRIDESFRKNRRHYEQNGELP